MENTNENYNEQNNMFEKRIIVDLVIIAIVLIFISIFFIYDIVDRGTINSSQTSSITYPDGNDPDNIDYTNENGEIVNPNVVEAEARLRIFEGTKEWSELKELDIFKKSAIHVAENKIAPGVEGVYTYTVENSGKLAMLYNMEFTEDNPYNVNMLYKLRLNGKYVAGNENKWVNISELKQTGLQINANTIDVFVIDWKWEDTDHDTEIGKTEGANYKIHIKADAEAITIN